MPLRWCNLRVTRYRRGLWGLELRLSGSWIDRQRQEAQPQGHGEDRKPPLSTLTLLWGGVAAAPDPTQNRQDVGALLGSDLFFLFRLCVHTPVM